MNSWQTLCWTICKNLLNRPFWWQVKVQIRWPTISDINCWIIWWVSRINPKKPWGRRKIYSRSMMEIFSERSSKIILWKWRRQERQQWKLFQLDIQNLEAAERSPFQKFHRVIISKEAEMWGVKLSSPETPTIKTTNKDRSNKTQNSSRGGRYQHSSQGGGRYGNIEQTSSPQDCLECCTNSGGRFRNSTSYSKTIFLQKGFTKHFPGRETETFSRKTGNL